MYENRFLKDYPHIHEHVESWLIYAKLMGFRIEKKQYPCIDELGFVVNDVYLEINILTNTIHVQKIYPPDRKERNVGCYFYFNQLEQFVEYIQSFFKEEQQT